MGQDENDASITLSLENGQFVASVNDSKALLDSIGESGGTAGESITEGFLKAEAIIETLKIGFEFIKDQIGESIADAMKYENSLNSMNTALANAGIYSAQTSASMKSFAEEMAKGSTFSTEMITSTEALAINYAKTEDGAKKLTEASLALSAATGKDVNTSMRLLGQSLTGTTNGLERLLPGLKNLSEEELKTGAAADVIISRFGGNLAAQTQTFSGHVQMLKNSFEELHEKMGSIVTQSPIVNRAIEGLTQLVNGLANQVEQWAKGGGFEKLLQSLINLGNAFVTYVVTPMEYVMNVGKAVFLEVSAGVDGMIFVIAKVAEAITSDIIQPLLSIITVSAKVISYFNKDFGQGLEDGIKKVSQTLGGFTKDFSASSEAVFKDAAVSGSKALQSMFDTPIADQLKQKVVEIKSFFDGAKAPLPDLKNNVNAVGVAALTVGKAFKTMGSGFKTEAADLAKSATKDFEKIGKSMMTTFASGAGSAFSAFGKALATGENALQAFGQALLKSIGEAAVQLGTKFILEGTAYLFAPGFEEFGPPLIAAGAALATFGGAISGLGGGGAPTSGGVGSSGGSAGGDPSAGTQPAQSTAATTSGTSAQIIIQGDYLNSRETANHLADVLRNNSDVTDFSITAQGQSWGG